ncbi:hypothetical protein BRADI_1g55163v3 [Brachypodium distachyon]|uniref:Uncharacterized protein n=1 Tax=Brachypodium distachyon TaxID=15368 RepID=A0A2K2DRH4_BRADI|nr:hypothetical protein BRADI_1g55163v3 [Brachypodium distachyon]
MHNIKPKDEDAVHLTSTFASCLPPSLSKKERNLRTAPDMTTIMPREKRQVEQQQASEEEEDCPRNCHAGSEPPPEKSSNAGDTAPPPGSPAALHDSTGHHRTDPGEKPQIPRHASAPAHVPPATTNGSGREVPDPAPSAHCHASAPSEKRPTPPESPRRPAPPSAARVSPLASSRMRSDPTSVVAGQPAAPGLPQLQRPAAHISSAPPPPPLNSSVGPPPTPTPSAAPRPWLRALPAVPSPVAAPGAQLCRRCAAARLRAARALAAPAPLGPDRRPPRRHARPRPPFLVAHARARRPCSAFAQPACSALVVPAVVPSEKKEKEECSTDIRVPCVIVQGKINRGWNLGGTEARSEIGTRKF